MDSNPDQSSKNSHSSNVGFFMASNSVPRSFQKTLMDRNTVDQGIVTGLTMAMNYTIGTVIQDVLDDNARKIAVKSNRPDKIDTYSVAMSFAAIGAGLLLQNRLAQKNNESLKRAGGRTLGYWLTQVGVAGVFASTLEKTAGSLSSDEKAKNHGQKLLNIAIVPLGAMAAILFDHLKYRKQQIKDEGNQDVSLLKATAIGVAISTVLGIISFGERKLAHSVNTATKKYLPAIGNSWLPLGHLIAAGAMFGGLAYGLKRIYKKIEGDESVIEGSFFDTPINNNVSGSELSYVHWSTLSLQGRRHIGTILNQSEIAKTLDLPIKQTKSPIRLYVGLDSADTEDQRVSLALKELERTNAYDRKILVIISPTGTGYVNYVMSDCVEYMSAGDSAMITIQYSKRPSPLSLDRIDEGYIQYRKLINGIRKVISKRPVNKRPKLVIFGESLGAWTSQDAFMYEGTDGFEANGIDNALWIGTPAESKWKKRALSGKSLNIQTDTIGVFNDYGQLQKLPYNKLNQLKYIMVTHDNDPVARFSASLLIQAPEWLKRDEIRPSTIPKSAHYRTPTTFIQTFVDMKNALKPVPGDFVATGHDYRGDLADFIRFTYGFDISEKQFININKQLRINDINRSKLMD